MVETKKRSKKRLSQRLSKKSPGKSGAFLSWKPVALVSVSNLPSDFSSVPIK